MTESDPRENLERRLDRILHELPLRRAPATLQARVLAELERRAALPWWRRRFGLWPLHARAGFLLLCGALAGVVSIGGAMAVDPLRSLSWTNSALHMMNSGATLVALATRYTLAARYDLPVWVYAVVAFCAVLYGVLFGLGAVVYRAAYPHPTAGVR